MITASVMFGRADAGAKRISLGGALALARAQARAGGDEEAAELLSFAKVSPSHGSEISVEVALPLEVVARRLAFCRGDADAGR